MYEMGKAMPEGCTLLKGTSFVDERGVLTFVEGRVLPFAVKRIFWISSVPKGKKRGGHAHRTCSEVVFAATGSFCIHLSDGIKHTTIRISSPGDGVVVPAGVWCDLDEFSADCVCVVAASQAYDPQGYINSYEAYLEYRKENHYESPAL